MGVGVPGAMQFQCLSQQNHLISPRLELLIVLSELTVKLRGEKEHPWCFLQLQPLRLEALTDFSGLKTTLRKLGAFGGKKGLQ